MITGPSAGVGKDTILGMFLDSHTNWAHPLSTTTRSPRNGEANGNHLNFIDQATFEEWQAEEKFLESDFHAGNWYGTLKEPVVNLLSQGQNVIIRVDVNGAQQIKQKLPNAITIMLMPESWESLEHRLRKRGTEDERAINDRLELAREETKYSDKFDHIVINSDGKPEQALGEVEEIVFG